MTMALEMLAQVERRLDHAHGRLAEYRLKVHLAFTGNSQVAIRKLVDQAGGFHDDIYARLQAGPGKGHEPGAQSTGCSSARFAADIGSELLFQQPEHPGSAKQITRSGTSRTSIKFLSAIVPLPEQVYEVGQDVESVLT